MPKTSKDFPATLNFGVELELKQDLVAMGYMEHRGGEYAKSARNLLWQAMKAWKKSLTDEQRKEYESILVNVKLAVPR